MKLTYWIAESLNDHKCYGIRGKTKKDVQERLDEWDKDAGYTSVTEAFGPVKKVTVEYRDGFDLMMQCMIEGSGWWEGQS